MGRARLGVAALVVVTVACAWLTAARLRVSGDLSTLLPASGEGAALVRWVRAFGARDPVVVLVRGSRPDDVERAARSVAESLRRAPSILRVLDGVPEPRPLGDPTLAWAFAGPMARARLAEIVTPAGMRARLLDTRTLLLAPAGGDELREWIERDPLRLSQVPWEAGTEVAAGLGGASGAAFVADGGRARVIVAQPRGSPFAAADARAVVDDVGRAMSAAAVAGVTLEQTGGHAVATATEQMLRRDLTLSGTLSAALASLAFVVTFRRVRALVAVLPPLVLGTLWTTGLAALLPTGLSAVAVAFAAVVVGVGVDTGVHVYAALLEARRSGASGPEAARSARAATWRPTLTAAAVAAIAFASLGLSGLRAMQQLGLLCGAGELLTAVAILLVTPTIGAWLERGPPPAPRPPRWVVWVARRLGTRRGAIVALAVCAAPAGIVAIVGWPRPAGALVALRPRALAPLAVQRDVQALFGGRPGQWVVLTADADASRARDRADRVAEALEPLARADAIAGFDSLTTFDPAPATRRARLAERDALDLPSRRAEFEAALRETGFDPSACALALEAFAHPSADADSPGAGPDDADAHTSTAWLLARHVARDGAETLVATYVRPVGDPASDARARAAIAAADPHADITGFDAIDRVLREALARDLALIGLVVAAAVTVSMRLALRSARLAFVALATLACEVGMVGLAMRLLGVRWHVYDALVLPVLFGVTVDESMFLLHAARDRPPSEALEAQGPLVASTAITTAAGFAALVVCRFDGLRDLGIVGAIGVVAGLFAALAVVPAALCLLGRTSSGAGS